MMISIKKRQLLLDNQDICKGNVIRVPPIIDD